MDHESSLCNRTFRLSITLACIMGSLKLTLRHAHLGRRVCKLKLIGLERACSGDGACSLQNIVRIVLSSCYSLDTVMQNCSWTPPHQMAGKTRYSKWMEPQPDHDAGSWDSAKIKFPHACLFPAFLPAQWICDFSL